jgi:hypothetical protein
MTTRLHIIANCADRKRLMVPHEHRLGAHRAHGSVSRLSSFVEALSAGRGDAVEAKDLYVGPYWAVVRELPLVAAESHIAASLWVASAGYGLVPGNAKLRGYSATFRAGEADSVACSGEPHSVAEQVSAWWGALAEWSGPADQPRRVTDLASADPDAHVMVVASPRYVQAMVEDLRGAAKLLGNRLIIVTSQSFGAGDPLSRNIVASEERLLAEVHGARPALHARVARHILSGAPHHGLDAERLRTRYLEIARIADFRRPPVRQPMTDQEVKRFIKAELRNAPDLSCTRALRILRDGERACEQKRFKNLFHGVASRVQ